MKRSFLNWTKQCVFAVLLAALCISGCKMSSDEPDVYIDEKQTLKIESGTLVSCNQEAEYIEIPNGVTSIGDSAFSNCNKLKSVTIPASVTHISGSAFNGCGSLTINYGGTKEQWTALKVSLPQGSYISCSDGTFESGGNPGDVQFPSSNPEDPYNPNLNPEQKTCTLYFYPNAPEGTPEAETLEAKTVTVNVGSYYTLPQEPIFNIEGYYFLGWTENPEYTYYTYRPGEEVWIPTELNIPDTYALYAVWGDTTYINGLEIYQNTVVGYIKDELPADVVIPDGVTAIGWRVFSPLSGREPCEIKSVTIPGSVQRIVEDAFSNCPKLEKVVIKEGELSELEWYAFSWCESLKTVELPDNVKIIGENAFLACPKLESITMNGVEKIEKSAFHGSGLTSVHLPNSLKFIGDKAFAECALESVSIPDSVDVENIEDAVFYGCKKLKKAVLPDGWEEIKWSMFMKCESLTEIIFPSALKIIGELAFDECSSLEEVVIPDGVTEIRELAFYDCERLSKVTIPNSVKTIGRGAFWCSPLSEIIIPDNTTVEGNAFSITPNLRTISIPASILNNGVKFWDIVDHVHNVHPEFQMPIINDYFSDCRNIDIILRDGATRIPKEFFYGSRNLYKSIKIPYGVKTIEEGAFLYAFCENTLEIPDSVTVIEDYALAYCNFAGKLPSKLEYIGRYALTWYDSESITIPGSIKFFGDHVFYDTALKSVIIEPGITEIPSGTFAAYRSDVPGLLEKIEIPNTVTKIGSGAFFYQPNLTDVKIPDSVKSIGRGAFKGCANLNAQVTGEWYRVNNNDETDIVDPANPKGGNLYWSDIYGEYNWYRK